jgi:hypothetical protein
MRNIVIIDVEVVEVRSYQSFWQIFRGVFRSIFSKLGSAAAFQVISEMEFLGRLG